MAMSIKKPYTVLAPFYDQFVAAHAPVLRRARRRILKRILPEAESACELCCGSGTTALEFARKGLKVYGVDASSEMCRVARRKLRREKLAAPLIRADMRSFRLPEQVDLVTCEFDALNHLPRKGDLDRVARAVHRALHPGGWFYFDVNTQRAFQNVWIRSSLTETAEYVLAAGGGFDRRRRMGWMNLNWFFPAGKLWRRCTEYYEQVAWSDSEIRRALRRAGFRHVRAWDGSRLARRIPSLRPGCRIFYLARKRLVGNIG